MKLLTKMKIKYPIELTLEEAPDPKSVTAETVYMTHAGKPDKIPASVHVKGTTLHVQPNQIIPAGEYEIHITRELKSHSGRPVLGDLVLGGIADEARL